MSRESVLREVTEADGAIILFIDEIHTVVGAGKADGAMDAGNLLKPALARGQLRCIGATARRGGSEGAASPSGPPLCVGATTLDEYRQHIEKDAALERRFQQAAVAGGGGGRASWSMPLSSSHPQVFVAQPTVEATTGILRGLKERCEQQPPPAASHLRRHPGGRSE